jgi:uncharacterized damage-inducible protein DinB
MEDELREAWQTNHRINLFLIDQISEEGMRSTLSKRGGRDVARQFAHLHNVRIYHMERRTKNLAEGLAKFESKHSPTKAELKKAFKASTAAVERFLVDVLNGVPKRRGFKKGIFTTLSYFIAHESHHRGSILLTLKECGHKLDNAASYGIWSWDQM